MYYSLDIINLMLFTAILFILRANGRRLAGGHRALHVLIVLILGYLLASVCFGFYWHARTGKTIVEPFFAYDTLYFAVLGPILAFMMLYFVDICLVKAKHVALIFPVPILMCVIFLFVNPKTGWMFSYENGKYQRGPFLFVNYLVWGVYMLVMIVMVIRARYRLGHRTLVGLLLFFGYEIGLQIYQFMTPDFYAGGVAFTTGMFYLVAAPIFLEPSRDELTGLYNRDGFMRLVQDTLRSDPTGEYQIIAVDVYHFREINERFGFQIGNQVLKYVGQFLSRQFLDQVEAARFDADQFFLIAPSTVKSFPMPTFNLRDCVPESAASYEFSIFAGVYPVEDRSERITQMCDRAVFALDQIKGDYNTRLAYFDAEAQKNWRFRTYIEQKMNDALSEGGFQVYYQPIVEMKTGRIAGAEALVRWKDEQYGMISPEHFIPLFEENGSIRELDAYVGRVVCAQLSAWKRKGLETVPVSVNISRVDLLTESFSRRFLAVVRENELTAADLRVEITEGSFVRREEIMRRVEELHKNGFKIMMDDFGSAYSNFNTFASMPVDILKVDMGFLENLERASRGQKILKIIVEMAQQLDMPIVVEGVETEDQFAQLKKIGVTFVQGFYIARPMPAIDFEDWLNGLVKIDKEK